MRACDGKAKWTPAENARNPANRQIIERMRPARRDRTVCTHRYHDIFVPNGIGARLSFSCHGDVDFDIYVVHAKLPNSFVGIAAVSLLWRSGRYREIEQNRVFPYFALVS